MSKEVKKPKTKVILKIKGWIDGRYVESILLEGRPAFLVRNTDSPKLSVEYTFVRGNKLYRPLEKNECGYMPYEFTREEIEHLNSVTASLGEIISDVFGQVQKYVAAPARDQILIAGDIVMTYCQEWIDTVHFPFFVGETESGKTFYPDEFDVRLTMNMLAGIVRFKFNAEKRIRYETVDGRKKKVTSYVFEKETVDVLSKKYHIQDSL